MPVAFSGTLAFTADSLAKIASIFRQIPFTQLRVMKALLCWFLLTCTALAQWPAAQAPVVPAADGYVAIPNAALAPDKGHSYRAIFYATHAAEKPAQLVPALNMAGSELNALAVAHVPLKEAKFVLVFHGPAVNGLLDNGHYKVKFGVDNPNLKTIAKMKQQGTEFYVCGQYLAGEKIDLKTLTPDVTVAADALLVLIRYQNNGYSLLSF